MALILYCLLVAALFVRVGTSPGAVAGGVERLRGPAAEVRLVRIHHGLFYLLLLASLGEYAIGAHSERPVEAAGAVLFAAGLALYRAGGRALGPALSPLLSPLGARFCREGAYRFIRHPMYLGQMLMAAGAPLVLGSYYSLAVTLAFAVVVSIRIGREERLLCQLCPGYAAYRGQVRRLIPFVY